MNRFTPFLTNQTYFYEKTNLFASISPVKDTAHLS